MGPSLVVNTWPFPFFLFSLYLLIELIFLLYQVDRKIPSVMCHNFEIILTILIFYNMKKVITRKYQSCLSWRFKEPTQLTHEVLRKVKFQNQFSKFQNLNKQDITHFLCRVHSFLFYVCCIKIHGYLCHFKYKGHRHSEQIDLKL